MDAAPIWIGERKPLASHGTGPFRNFIAGLRIAEFPGALGKGIITDRDIPQGTVVWEADVDQKISKVLTEEQMLALPPSYRDAWLGECSGFVRFAGHVPLTLCCRVLVESLKRLLCWTAT